MGCDGGSIPRREELVQLKKEPEKIDQNQVEKIKWFSCALSKDPLRTPVVTCELGRLYNKEAVIKNLIERSMPESCAPHIRSLKDVFPVNFKNNPNFNTIEKSSVGFTDLAEDAPFICPITGLEVGGNHKFSVLKSCGCAFSNRSLKECPSDSCLVCAQPFSKEDILSLNPTEEELDDLKQKLKEKRALEPPEVKKDKRKKKRKAESQKVEESSAHADKKLLSGSIDLSLVKNSKKKVAQAPPNADKKVYASLFTSSKEGTNIQENFLCRNVARA